MLADYRGLKVHFTAPRGWKTRTVAAI